MIKLFALVFIVYELFKIAKAEQFLNVVNKVKGLDANHPFETIEALKDKTFIALVATEMVYVVFVVALLFSSYWLVSVLLLSLAILFYKRKSEKIVTVDGVLSALILMLVFIL